MINEELQEKLLSVFDKRYQDYNTKERFIKMLEQAKEDEYGRLYVLGEYNNKIYFGGTITTICEDIKYKEPERIEEFSFNKNNTLIEEDLADMKDKINELVRISNKYSRNYKWRSTGAFAQILKEVK